MANLSLTSLADDVRRLTAQHSRVDGPTKHPLLIAPNDPFVEPLVYAYADRLPVPIRKRMLESDHVDDVSGWLAVGAIYELVASEPNLRSKLLGELQISSCQPGDVALAVAKAYSAQHLPPVQSTGWKRLDRHGLFLQLGIAVTLCMLRGLVVFYSATWVGCLHRPFHAVDFVLSTVGWPLLTGDAETALGPQVAMMLLLSSWLLAEAALAPRLFEAVRQLPAVIAGEPPPVSWRADAFAWAWFLFALALAFATVARAVVGVACTWLGIL